MAKGMGRWDGGNGRFKIHVIDVGKVALTTELTFADLYLDVQVIVF